MGAERSDHVLDLQRVFDVFARHRIGIAERTGKVEPYDPVAKTDIDRHAADDVTAGVVDVREVPGQAPDKRMILERKAQCIAVSGMASGNGAAEPEEPKGPRPVPQDRFAVIGDEVSPGYRDASNRFVFQRSLQIQIARLF